MRVVTFVDALVSSRMNQGFLCNPGTTATVAEARKVEKYWKMTDNGFVFQPVAEEVQSFSDQSSETFIMRLCNCFVIRTTINEQAAF